MYNNRLIGKNRCPETVTALLVDNELFLGSSVAVAPGETDILQNQALSRLWQTVPSPGMIHHYLFSTTRLMAMLPNRTNWY
jgi:hypothetical protein